TVRGRPALPGGGPVARACQISAALSQDHADQCHAQELGQSHAADVLRQDHRYLRRVADRLGLEFPELGRHAVRDSRCRAQSVRLRQGLGSGLDLRQDRARALSNSRQVTSDGSIRMTTATKLKLQTMLGNYPNTKALKSGEISSGLVDFDFV